MNQLFIVGASGAGRQALDWALDVPPEKRDWEVAGFLDDRLDILKGKNCAFGILSSVETYQFRDTDRVICAMGEPAIRLEYCGKLKMRGARFISLIHPTAIIGSNTTWGEGCIFGPGVVLTNNVTIGNYVLLNVYATIGHDAKVGDGCTVSAHADVTGGATLGEAVFLGSHAVVMPNARVAGHTVIGACSAVLRRTEAHTTVMGVPAVEVYRRDT